MNQPINDSIHEPINTLMNQIQSGIYSACHFYTTSYNTRTGNSRILLRCSVRSLLFWGISILVHLLLLFMDFGRPGDNSGGNFSVLEHLEAPKVMPWIPRCLQVEISRISGATPENKVVPFFSIFSFWGILFWSVCCGPHFVTIVKWFWWQNVSNIEDFRGCLTCTKHST